VTAGAGGKAIFVARGNADTLAPWSSPPLLDDVSLNSLGFYDLNAESQLEMTIGTTFGMYMTR
jgi:hypothetical protein